MQFTRYLLFALYCLVFAAQQSTFAGVITPPNILVILIDFSDATSQSVNPNGFNLDSPDLTQNKFTGTGKSVNKLYKQSTYDQLQLSPSNVTITPWLRIQKRKFVIAQGTTIANVEKRQIRWIIEASELAVAAGPQYDPRNFPLVFVVTPKVNSLIASAATTYQSFTSVPFQQPTSTVEGKRLVFVNGPQSAAKYAHELGHALGLQHFGLVSCPDQISDNLSLCNNSNYAPITFMGVGQTSLTAFHRDKLNTSLKTMGATFFDNRVQTVTQDGVYTISPLQNSTGGEKKALKITFPLPNGREIWLEYRQPIGIDATTELGATNDYNGKVWVTLPYAGPVFLPKPSDPFPDNPFNNAPDIVLLTELDNLDPNHRTFFDKVDGVTITELAHDTASATLEIRFAPCQEISLTPGAPYPNSGNLSFAKQDLAVGALFKKGEYELTYLGGSWYSTAAGGTQSFIINGGAETNRYAPGGFYISFLYIYLLNGFSPVVCNGNGTNCYVNGNGNDPVVTPYAFMQESHTYGTSESAAITNAFAQPKPRLMLPTDMPLQFIYYGGQSHCSNSSCASSTNLGPLYFLPGSSGPPRFKMCGPYPPGVLN